MKLVYKYYAPEDYNLDAIEKQYFYFRHVGKLNDPFDSNILLFQPEEYAKIFGPKDKLEEIVSKYGTCSFSERRDNLTLWALYADCHKGFVVAYDADEFESMNVQFNGVRFPFYKINYVTEPIRLDQPKTTITLKSWNGDSISHSIEECYNNKDPKLLDFLFLYMINMKSSNWSNEEEWRLFVGLDLFVRNKQGWSFRNDIPGIEEDNEKLGYKVNMPSNVIHSIILGCNMEEKTKTKLIAIAEKLGVSIYETELGTPYQLNFKPIRQQKL